MTGAIAMGTSKITGLGNPTSAQDAATKTYVDTADALKLNLTGGTMSGAIAMGTNKITGVGNPTLAQDAATKDYVDDILGSATSAATSAAAASTSASNAATSASNAASSATASANSASAAAASYDAFDDRYLGDKASDPTLDNDGNALLTGALYFNTTSDVMKVYDGSAWNIAAISSASPTFTGTVTIPTADINGGTIDGTLIGGTTAAAGSFTNVTVSGTVDGRDIASDGSKLDTIETNADVTDTTNVTAAGALMDSELTDIASVKALNQGVATTDDPTFTNTLLASLDVSIADTAVDVFVYDTRKDSDGGAWRKRTQHTSWYNETLNTGTRGSRRDFPAVAVIVAESNQLTIYDGDDPDLPMWMVFNGVGARSNQTAYYLSVATLTGLSALNGKISVSHYGTVIINMIADSGIYVGSSIDTKRGTFTKSIVDRNSTQGYTSPVLTAVHYDHNDVAMTVLPNAPIDAATGLPVPTIAVATDGGVSVIKDDGTVVDINYGSYNASKNVFFTGSNGIFASFDNVTANNRYGKVWNTIPSSDLVVAGTPYNQANGENANYSAANITGYVAEGRLRIAKTTINSSTPNPEGIDFALPQGVSRLYTYETSPDKGMFSLIASTYNTGWMNGDIKLATLSDTDDTDVTGSQLVTNGTFDTDTTGWTGQNNATLSVVSGALRVTNDGSTSYPIAAQSFATEVGKTYTVSARGLTSPTYNWYIEIIGGGGTAQTNDEYKSYTFTAASTSSTLRLVHRGGANGNYKDFDDVSIRIAEEDRSVNNNGLQVFGTITKNPVATGADLVAYSGFSASNYLEQPYNSDLDFGTGDFSISFWFKPVSGNAYQALFHRDSLIASPANSLLIDTGVGFAPRYIIGSGYIITGSALPTNTWSFIVMKKDAGVGMVYVNGILEGSIINPSNITNTSAVTRVGGRTNDVYPLTTSSLALFRMSATAPTAEQIAKIYNDEKVLFQENSQATLYSSSDAVTALAYDDDTELLHVGTSAGRSVFQGLRRVDNTTDAVGAAISASNGLIAED
jgi:trimeric autotransporter adhesin